MEWHKLQRELGEEYRKEELYWHQKSRIQWLKEGIKIRDFFILTPCKEEEGTVLKSW